MAGITATGIGSNLDVSGLVTRLMDVEKQPLATLDKKQAAVLVKISAYASFRGSLSAFQTTLVGLEQASAYTASRATIGDPSVATASAGPGADAGAHTLEVTNLAAAQRLKSGTFSALTDVVGTGTITIQAGTFDADTGFAVNGKRAAQTITIDAGHSSLAGVRDAINAAKVGVSASIVNDGTGFRLVLASKDSGTENSLRISVSDTDGDALDTSGLSRFAYDPGAAVGAGKNMTQVVAAEDATFLMDGIAIRKSSNTVSDVIAGTTLTLLKTNVGTPTALSVAQDTTPARTAVDDFVKAYNELNKAITSFTKYDAASKTAGPLQGDVSIRSVATQLRDGLSNVISGISGGYHALAQIGITLDRNGALNVDTGKLQTALVADPHAVQGLFGTSGFADDALVTYVKSNSGTPVGQYELDVSQLATQGKTVGSAAAALIIDATNDGLTVSINGVIGSIKLSHGTYTSATTLAAELQSQLNGNSAFAGASITASVTEASGVLSITSDNYGALSKVSLSGGIGQTALFGATPTATDGIDIAGNVGGSAGIGKGQELAHSNGLTVKVAGGSTGARGNVHFGRGIAVQLDELIGKVTGTKGMIASRTDSLNQSIKQIESDRDRMNAQLLVKQARYTKQFNTLDGLISSTQSTMTYLQQQLSSLNKY